MPIRHTKTHLLTSRLGERRHELAHGGTLAGAEVDGDAPAVWVIAYLPEGRHVSVREVHDVDVVALASSVRGRVVVSIDGELLTKHDVSSLIARTEIKIRFLTCSRRPTATCWT